jgi:DNA-binding response OmpR family regulator
MVKNGLLINLVVIKLRGYLKEDPNLQIITIKGVGYRFVAD